MKFRIILLLLVLTIAAGCKKSKDDSSKTNLLVLAALASGSSGGLSSNREMYNGFADIPASIYKTVASGASSSSVQSGIRTLATTDYRFQNSTNTASVSQVYDLVRVTAKATRDITKSIGDLVKSLESLNITVSSTALTGTDKWGDQPSKFSYKSSSKLTNGKLLEVWWNNASAPYSNNKAIELNYTGSTASGNISGYVFIRYISKAGATTLSKAYIKFEYSATANTRTMVVILQDIGNTYTDRAHFFVKEENGVTSLDGTYTVMDFNVNATGVGAAPRAYVFSAIGNATKGVVNAAFPLTTDTTTAIYGNTALGNIGQVWTNFIFANGTLASTLNGLPISGCTGQISTTPNFGNPTSSTGVTTVANLKVCLDAIIKATSTDNVKDVYFLTNIKNPAYFSVANNAVSLYGVESLDAGDANKAAFDALQNNAAFLSVSNTARTTSNTTYPASFDAVSVTALNLFTGLNVPTGSSATDLTKLNAQWGNGTPGTGTSSSGAGTNTVNGSIDNVAPF